MTTSAPLNYDSEQQITTYKNVTIVTDKNLEGNAQNEPLEPDSIFFTLHSLGFSKFLTMFCILLPGVGSQFIAIATGILVMALLGMFNVHRHGSINAASIVLYALTSCIAGYVAANMYRKMAGDTWVWNINLTSCLFAGELP